jgi:hypothetical protein
VIVACSPRSLSFGDPRKRTAAREATHPTGNRRKSRPSPAGYHLDAAGIRLSGGGSKTPPRQLPGLGDGPQSRARTCSPMATRAWQAIRTYSAQWLLPCCTRAACCQHPVERPSRSNLVSRSRPVASSPTACGIIAKGNWHACCVPAEPSSSAICLGVGALRAACWRPSDGLRHAFCNPPASHLQAGSLRIACLREAWRRPADSGQPPRRGGSSTGRRAC